METSTLLPELAMDFGETVVGIVDSHSVHALAADDVETVMNAFRFLRSLHRELLEQTEAELTAGVAPQTLGRRTSTIVERLGRFVASFGQSVAALGPEDPADGDLAEYAHEARGLLQDAKKLHECLSFINAVPPPTANQSQQAAVAKDNGARIPIAAFLEEVYELARVNDVDGATDRIFDFTDRMLSDGQFGACDEVLRTVDVDKLSTALMRSFLSITAAAKQKLPSRPALYRKIEQKMIERRGAEKARTILANLA